MPKMKSKSSLNKRVKTRKSGAVKRSHAKTSHLFSNKSTKSKRKARKQVDMDSSDAKRYKDILR